MNTIGQKIRSLRKAQNMTQRDLAKQTGINFTYLSRIENDRLDAEQTPREDTLRTIALALQAEDELDELLILAKRIPETIKQRILDRPALFRRMLSLSDDQLEKLLEESVD